MSTGRLRELGLAQMAEALGGPNIFAQRDAQLQRQQVGEDLRSAAGAFRALGTPRAARFADQIEAMPDQTIQGLAGAGMDLRTLYGTMLEESKLEVARAKTLASMQPQVKLFDLAKGVRTDMNRMLEPHREIEANFANIVGIKPGSTGSDVSLINSYVRMVDPGSVVKKSDMGLILESTDATAQRMFHSLRRFLTPEGALTPYGRFVVVKDAQRLIDDRRRFLQGAQEEAQAEAERMGLSGPYLEYVVPGEIGKFQNRRVDLDAWQRAANVAAPVPKVPLQTGPWKQVP